MIEITPEDSIVPVFLVELTEEEAAERDEIAAQSEAERIAAEQEVIAKQAAKASALAKLSALGLTPEEVEAIIGV